MVRSFATRSFSIRLLAGSAFIALALLVPTSALRAQTYRGSIHGRVTDGSGRVLPNNTVVAKNIDTGATRSAATDASGAFAFPEMLAGQYDIATTATGLAPVTQRVIVNVGADTSIDLMLKQLSSTVQTVEVNAQAPVLERSETTLGALMDNKLVQDLPLNGRDFGKLVALTPGVTVEGSGVAGTEKGFGQFNVNGNRDRSNNYLLDGTDNNDPFFNNSALNQVGITGAPASLLPVEAIQEFNIQTSYGAEYGRNAGATVNIVTRSGSNHFHGSAFEYWRSSSMDARNYFNTRLDRNGLAQAQSHFNNHNFGGSFGGPIRHDRTFFFGAYEGQREAAGSDFLLSVPNASQIAQARAIAQANGSPNINPGLDAALRYFPLSDSNLLHSTVQDTNNLNSFIAKVDHQFSERQQLAFRYAFSQGNQVYPLGSLGGYGSGSRLAQFAQTSPTRVQVLSASFLSIPTSNLINEVRFGYSRYTTSFSSRDGKLDPASIGLLTGTGEKGLPEFDFSGVIENLGATAFSVPRARTSQTYQGLDNVTWTHGGHAFKVGGEYRRADVNSFNDNLERGLLFFSPGTVTDTAGNPIANQPGDQIVQVLANYYLGNGNAFNGSANIGNTRRDTYNNGFGAFAQDSYKVTAKLTLNYGLRYEYFGVLGEKNHLISNLSTAGVLAMVGQGGLKSAYDKNWMNLSPRAGFALQLHSSTVLRGGYGIYYDYIPQNNLIANFTNSSGIVTNPIGPKAVLPLQFNQLQYTNNAPGAFYSIVTSGPFNIFVTPRRLPTPYSQGWNLNLQQELTRNLAIEAGYVGSKGTHLTRLYDANQPDQFGHRPNADFSYVDTFTNAAWSTYHSLQLTVRGRNVHGFAGLATYNYSKSLDTASDAIDFNFASAALPQDATRLAAEYGPSTFDTRQRFTAALSYALPAARVHWLTNGLEFNSIISVQTGRPIPITTSFDTSECNPSGDNCSGGGGSRDNFHQRPNRVSGVNPINSHWNGSTPYLRADAFSQPDFGTFGNLGRNAIFGPGFLNVDVGALKRFNLPEGLGLELRAEAFNVINHPNFALPSGSYGTSSFGTFSQTPDVAQGNPGLGGGGPRVLQMAGKITF